MKNPADDKTLELFKPAQTAAERTARYEAKKKEKGLTLLRLWVTPEEAEELKERLAELRGEKPVQAVKVTEEPRKSSAPTMPKSYQGWPGGQ